jgi:glycosyltransferase involved in cell wall biosynthesis
VSRKRSLKVAPDAENRVASRIVDEGIGAISSESEEVLKSVSESTGFIPYKHKKYRKICITITTYNRSKDLVNLLNDIKRSSYGYEVYVQVYNDCSDEDYFEAEKIIEESKWGYVRFKRNHGKRKFWKIINTLYSDNRKRKADLFIQLQDDLRLCNNFIDKAISEWESINIENKISLNILKDESRAEAACWTGIEPMDLGSIEYTGWVDCIYVCERSFFEKLGWVIKPISKDRWNLDPGKSTGVGQQTSTRLHQLGCGMFRVKKSLVVHVHSESRLNSGRDGHSMSVVEFVDGEKEAALLAIRDKVTVSLATIPRRSELLEGVVFSLLPQADIVNVYLNNYPEVPEYLFGNEKIVVATSQEHGDLGDAGKFFWSDEISGFHFTCDDDIYYPPDYVSKMIEAIEVRGRRAAVGVHGSILLNEFKTYYKSRKKFHFSSEQSEAICVNLLGTGTLAYHSSAIDVHSIDFAYPNMADVWFGELGQSQSVPFVCIDRGHMWLYPLEDGDGGSIYSNSFTNDMAEQERVMLQDSIIKRNLPWKIFEV